ncbi:MAG: galactose-1-phosphate uridylyltransferase [Nitrososphaerales archaeon]
MAELRKDYFTDRFSIVNKERILDLPIYEEEEDDGKDCPLCVGKEDTLPPAEFVLSSSHGSIIKTSDSIERVKEWKVRMIPNPRSLVSLDVTQTYSESPLYSEPAYGYDYILIASPDHKEKFHKMSLEQWTYVLISLQDRIKSLLSKKKVIYVMASITQGKRAGVIYSHPYCRIVTLPRLPLKIEEEAKTVQTYKSETGSCIMCDVIKSELGGPRHILSTDHFVALTPWAPTHDFEFWIFPSKHETDFQRITQREISDCVKIIRACLGALAKILKFPSFNMVIHTSPEKKITKKIDWHVEIYPTLRAWGSLEKGMGIYEIQVSPEVAAEKLRQYAKREFADLTFE